VGGCGPWQVHAPQKDNKDKKYIDPVFQVLQPSFKWKFTCCNKHEYNHILSLTGHNIIKKHAFVHVGPENITRGCPNRMLEDLD